MYHYLPHRQTKLFRLSDGARVVRYAGAEILRASGSEITVRCPGYVDHSLLTRLCQGLKELGKNLRVRWGNGHGYLAVYETESGREVAELPIEPGTHTSVKLINYNESSKLA